jgi:hypothetical protein
LLHEDVFPFYQLLLIFLKGDATAKIISDQ